MSNRLSQTNPKHERPLWGNQIICLVIVAIFILAGCGKKHQIDVDVLACGPEVEKISVPSDYAAQAVEATGGLEAWMKTKKLQLDCVVTFYQPDGSFYLTEQHYDVYPWSNSIKISADEPQGSFVWQLSKGQFDVLQGSEKIDRYPQKLAGHCFAEVILNIITAPVRFLDESAEFTKQSDAIKIQGQWYYQINRRSKPGAESTERSSKAVFYQDRDNSLVDMIWLAFTDTENFLTVRGYDYDEIAKDDGILIPVRIEIFSTDAHGNSPKRLVKIDCHTLRHTN